MYDHTCSIGLRSGDLGGHSRQLIPSSLLKEPVAGSCTVGQLQVWLHMLYKIVIGWYILGFGGHMPWQNLLTVLFIVAKHWFCIYISGLNVYYNGNIKIMDYTAQI